MLDVGWPSKHPRKDKVLSGGASTLNDLLVDQVPRPWKNIYGFIKCRMSRLVKDN